MKKEEWFFYIVRCADNSLYSGVTNNLKKRLAKHNCGQGARYTAIRRPVKLIYSEKYRNLSSARKREEQVKRWDKSKKITLIEEGFI